MIFIKNIILNYINSIKKEDIINYSVKNNIKITSNDVEVIYNYTKYRYKDFFMNPSNILNELKDKLSNSTYNELIILYNKYKFFIDKINY